MLEGYAQYYSDELSQKIRRGNNESRLKGNLTGGTIPYGYTRVNKKAVIVEDEANVVRYIFEQYASGVIVRKIVKILNDKGITHKGKMFINNTIYNILKNERYSGIYRYKDQIFDNIYPRIVSQEIFDIVCKKVAQNQYGSNCVAVNYLLKHKVKCGYCGLSIIGESGTSHNGRKMYYYKCRGRKERLNDCKKSSIRKDELEKLVLDCVIEALENQKNKETIVQGIMQIQKQKASKNTVLNLLMREKRSVDNSIQNPLTAIEKGVITNTTTKRLKDLEKRQANLERQIAIERNKTAVLLTESEIREYYEEALRLEPQLLITYLIREIKLFDDKVEIYFSTPKNESPDD